MQAHKIMLSTVNLTAGAVVQIIKRKERDSDQCEARHGSIGANKWRNQPKTIFSMTEQGEERKATLKLKPHRVRKPFQVAAGYNLTIIPNFVINTYTSK